MRKAVIGVLTGAAFFAIVAIAIAAANNVSYTATIKEKGKPSKAKPSNISYTGTLDVTRPDGSQPDTAPTTDIFFAKGIVTNGKKFPSCTQADIDGKTSVPAKCKKAVVGQGTANSQLGTPGQQAAIKPQLTVTAYNNKGKQILLALNNQGLGINNRIIPGTLSAAPGWAYKVTFAVPQNLQTQLGSQIALTHFDVTINNSKTVKVKSGKKTIKESYLVLTSCPKSKTLPNRAIVHFNQDNGQPGGETDQVDNTYACT